MTLDGEIEALEKLLSRAPSGRNARLLHDVHYRLVLFRNVIAYLEHSVPGPEILDAITADGEETP